jgi:AraC family transcriptional regulator of adaptative response / DNA-3-methyladenine glycosylase II
MLDGGEGLETLARKFGWSSRQIRRMLNKEFGISPVELLMTRRLLLAKQLLTETDLPVSRVALASGFSSVRRFNDAFVRRYQMPPTRLRKASNNSTGADSSSGCLALQLAYRPPLAWEQLLRFVGARAMKGVEWTDGEEYFRTARLGSHSGWIRVSNQSARRVLLVEVTDSLTPALPALLGRMRHLFDLSARPDVIEEHLSRSEALTNAAALTPGLRVPGTFDGFELAARAILGQQISVKAATTLAGRFATAFGEPIDVPHDALSRLAPTAERIAALSVTDLSAIGMTRTRASSMIALAVEIAAGRLLLEPGADPDEAIEKLVALPGIGPWTANYIAMRALRWPDAFLRDDAVVRQRLGGVSGAQAEALSRDWSPWRAYAVMQIWGGAPPKA